MLKRSFTFALLAMLACATFAVQAKTVTIEGTDSLRFSVEKITVKPGEKVTVKLVNKTDMPAAAMSHDWVLLKQDADPKAYDHAAQSAKDNGYIPESKSDEVIAHTGLVAGGESDRVTFTEPEGSGK